MNCSVCGAELPGGSRVCPECGAPNDLSAGAGAGEPAPPEKPGGNKKRRMILVVVIIVVAAVVIAALLLTGAIGGNDIYSQREPAPNQVEMPGGGKQIEITGATDILFSPKDSAFYVIFTDKCGSGDPILELYDKKGSLIKSDDDSFGDGNAMIYMYLTAGKPYRIYAGFKGDGGGSCTFRIFSPVGLAGSDTGGEVNDWGVYSFKPDRSGTWRFNTLPLYDESVDPFIRIYDAGGNIIAEDDNSGDGNQAEVKIDLVSGETYGMFMSSHGSGRGDFVVVVVAD